jgi:hypothetical protein
MVYLTGSSVPHHCVDFGSITGNDILATATWKWGYGIWCIILPVVFLPLAITLFLNNKKAKKIRLTTPSAWKGLSVQQTLMRSLFELGLDLDGILLLRGAFALIFIPLTIASKSSEGWGSGSNIEMPIIGIICFLIFPIWESNRVLAPLPLIPLHLLKSRTFSAGCGVGFFYFSTS